MAIRPSDGDDLQENHEINVTPFIDVMLVLLIIFMVAAPLSTVDVGVDLPSSTAQKTPRPDTPLIVTVREDRTLYVGNDPIATDTLGSRLDAETEGDRETRVFLRADRSLRYEDVVTTMNRLRDAGYHKLALVGLDSVSDVPEPDAPSETSQE
ncbi:TonB system transport protein ExbD [Amorphus orientalis]|uniref:Biopolymer transport protein ExbD n=1 Tax=Amorphus orientalis TaxID=649198 RepID=A0AAE4AUM5_9HYPH|nr:TonB system transport protein ExbD [Amorphus orientalis]MDQ0317307.1 biopolymer transport protein ExbD [Amorphus orientalis]